MPPEPPPDRTETLAPRPGTEPRPEPQDPSVEPSEALDHLAADDPDRYQQVAEHARGGLGRVVRAVDRRLGRTVAVKELLRHDPANEARFLREAMITARLEHPGIVPVHEAGRWPNGDPYYVMKLVEGRTLKVLIGEGDTLRERLGLLPHVIAVADAVGYAHSEGVIHRDLKPSNVVVGGFGETIVVDWGLARDRKRDLPEPSDEILAALGSGVSTVSGKVVGTPAYMSPEQARGDLVDERADVYALGAVLYEVLAGAPPHTDTTPQAVLDRVIAGPPCPLPVLVPGVSVELATIVRKAMARDPAARYPNAVALAEDLRRFTTGQLVSAHSYTAWSRVRKKLARHRGVVAVVLASLVMLFAIGAASFRRVVAERNIARDQRGLAEEALASAEKRKRELVLLQAETALPRDPTAALAWLKTYDIRRDDRAAVVDVLDEALALGVARHVLRVGEWVIDAQYTPDGRTLITTVRDGSVRAYDLATGASRQIGVAPASPMALALTPDGETAITGDESGAVHAWPITGGAPRLLVARGAPVTDLRLGPDGRVLVMRDSAPPLVVSLAGGEADVLAPASGLRFAVADADWARVVVSTSANEVAVVERDATRALARTDRPIGFFALSPDGNTVVVHDGATLWQVPFAGGELRKLARYDGRINLIVWSPDRHTLAISGTRSEILLVDARSEDMGVRELRGHTDAIYMMQFTRNGERLLSASDDATARVWQLSSQEVYVLRGHSDDVYRARFSPDERSVVTASMDGSARVWSIDQATTRVWVEPAAILNMSLDRTGGVLVRAATGISRWDLATGERAQVFSWAGAANHLGYGVLSPDARRVVIPNADGSLELRDREGHVFALRGHRGLITHVEFMRDGRAVLSSSVDGTLRRWDAATGAGEILMAPGVWIRGFAIARDGRILLQAGDAAYMIEPGGQARELGRGGAWCIDYAEFEPVTDRLLAHRCDKTVAIIDPQRVIELPTGGYNVARIAMSPDRRLIAAGLSDRTVRLWDAASGQLVDVLRGHSDFVYDVAFSPESDRLASASYDKTIWVWDLASKRHRVLRGHAGSVIRVAWNGSDHLVSASPDATVRLWDVPSLTPATADIERQLDAATTARIDRDRPASGSSTSRGT